MKTKTTLKITRTFLPIFVAFAMILAVVGTGQAYTGVPLISIKAVDEDVSVTVYGSNFPKNQVFTVRMGKYGTYALGGTVVGTYDSTAGSTFTATYSIPTALKGLAKIAIRLDSPQGYYSYNWFYNNDADTTIPVPPAPVVYPTFSISAVTRDDTVTVVTANLPEDQEFTVRMGEYGTKAIGGKVVDTFDSDEGGTQTLTFDIPAALAGRTRIAIRMDSDEGFYAYNWFWNNTTGDVPDEPVEPGYTGYPTFLIDAVVKNTSVTVEGYNFPPDQEFTVRMGEYGTLGIGGIVVGSFDSGDGGDISKTFTIPAALAGRYRIAIRMDTGYYYAYNWFFNNTTD